MGFAFSPSVESARGIICVWDSTRFIEVSILCYSRFIVVKGSWIVENELVGFICIYAPNNHLERVSFLESLISFVNA